MKTIKANFKLKKNENIYYMPDIDGKIVSLYFEDAEGEAVVSVVDCLPTP